jgi:hypothetical protein
MIDIITLLTTFNALLIAKIAVLLLIFVYLIFAIVVVVQARAFNRIIYIGDSFESLFIQTVSFIHLIATISLFLLALAIL